jgi:hypothetical protein
MLPSTGVAGCIASIPATGGWVVTKQIRKVSAGQFRWYAAEITLSAEELDEVRHVLGQMLIIAD